MRNLLLASISAGLIITCASPSFGQGQLYFGNQVATPILLGGGFIDQGPLKMYGSAGTFDFGLYMGSAGSSSLAQMQLVDLVTSPDAPASTSFNAGLFGGGTIDSPGNVANTINFAAGTTYAFYVAGWSAAAGSTYEQALESDYLGYVGLSALGYVTPTAFPGPPPELFGTAAGQIGGFTLYPPVPEPGTIILGGLGAAALLLFSSRK